MLRRWIALTMLLSACARPELGRAKTTLDESDPYRPGWTGSLPLIIDGVRTCVEGRLPPTLVLNVSSRPSGATGVITVDGVGATERCAAADGRVVHREPIALRPEMFEGFPVFVVGAETPTVDDHVLLEEVHAGEELIGWLFWPPAGSVRTLPSRAVEDEHAE